MTITLTEKLKAAGSEPLNAAAALPRGTELSAEGISIRSLSPTGEFSHAVRAFPGYVTVVQENGKEQLRDALLGKSGELELRVGAQELHRSEIYLVQNHEALLKEPSVGAALRAAGAPEQDVAPVLEKVGLAGAANTPPRDLGNAALKQLAIGCSLYARARILLYDRPFAGSDPAVVERIAQLLLSMGEGNARAMIITGEAQLPPNLRNSARVILQDPRKASGTVTMPGAPAASVSVRDLMQTGQVLIPEGARLVTRPQTIYSQVPPRAAESLQTEAITNPRSELAEQHLGGGAGVSQLGAESMQAARREGGEESPHNEYKPKKKRLTTVRKRHRIKQFQAYRIVDELVRKVRSRISARPGELDLPAAARITVLNKRRELNLGTAIFIMAVLAMCGIAYMHGL